MVNGEYYILGLAIIFLVLLVFIQRKMSIKIILEVLFTLLVLHLVLIRGIVNEKNIVILGIIVAFLISFVNIFIKNGIHRKSFTELLALLMATIVSSVLLLIVCNLTKVEINFESQNLNNDFIFGAFVIVFLGTYMDTISKMISKLDEEKNKTEDISLKEQFKLGVISIKDIVLPKISMIFLIFLGISVFPVYVYISKGYNLTEILNVSEIFLNFAVAFIGNIGLILSIFITSIVYAILNRKKIIYKTVSENKIDGKRSLKL